MRGGWHWQTAPPPLTRESIFEPPPRFSRQTPPPVVVHQTNTRATAGYARPLISRGVPTGWVGWRGVHSGRRGARESGRAPKIGVGRTPVATRAPTRTGRGGGPPPPFGNHARVVVVGRGSTGVGVAGVGADREEAGHWWARFGVGGGGGGGRCQTVRRHGAVWRAVARDTVRPPCGVLGVNARWRGRWARQVDGHLVPDGRGWGAGTTAPTTRERQSVLDCSTVKWTVSGGVLVDNRPVFQLGE